MNKSFSIYLDLVRFTAACLVYLWHSNKRLLMVDVPPAASFGHSAVVVFFVLSGRIGRGADPGASSIALRAPCDTPRSEEACAALIGTIVR